MARRSYDWGYLQPAFSERPRVSDAAVQIALPGSTLFQQMRIETAVVNTSRGAEYIQGARQEPEGWMQYLDYDRLVFPLIARFRRAGDTFRPLGMQGKKSLKKFFIDRKVPRHKRKSIPVLVDGDGIIGIVGVSIAERVKITPQTRTIVAIRVYYR
ncbi:tRNA lysidine(34) synthetase TilS [candidate division KSB3 bacterium]|uniref:tRNA lysidine(34) synthetase TilS n=1 Tax=candidate division KSB3 bacterium TaxID=2044937 RepID=A0A9D5JUQ1_9BACT|nr:tRNA lysidine(34) synthetase TilS [candidate division KSB3 bacterium]MBD3324469.1 tRNA lysidine(34) synthetase TilS [candidate division KSB3 bacterium]